MSDIEKVKKLREATGAGFKDCNLAIKESNGDLDKAVEILRVKGISKASKKMSRDAKEGVVAISGDKNKTSIPAQIEKKEPSKKESKGSSKTIVEIDREKLEEKFSQKNNDQETIN